MSDLASRLRALPAFPEDLPLFDPAAVPADPTMLLLDWLGDAIASGERQPHAVTVTTVDDDGFPANRTLIVKDLDSDGIHFSSSLASRKADHLAERPYVGMLFFWRPLGRQVEVTGNAEALSAETSAADWRQRPNFDGRDNPDWQVWSLHPSRFEFLQATHDRAHVRVEYRRTRTGWTHRRLRPSEAPPEST